MPDAVLRIPVDDEAFQRYMEAFKRYQTDLSAQPGMWGDVNERIIETAASNLALADAITSQVSAIVRVGDAQARNYEQDRRAEQDEESAQVRQASWRRRALDHVQELSRTSASMVRSLGNFASSTPGGGATGGLFSMVESGGKALGGTLGGIVNLAGHVLNAGYEINNAIADKGQYARGMGATVGEQEGFSLGLGRYVNTDQGIDSVMNSRGNAGAWTGASILGARSFFDPNATNAQAYGDILRRQVDVARRYTNGNITNWQQVEAHGGTAYGTSAEDLNRLMKAPNFEAAISEAVSRKSPIGDKQIDAATKSVVAIDKATTTFLDSVQAGTTTFDGALDGATKGLQDLANVAEKIANIMNGKTPRKIFNSAIPTIHQLTQAQQDARDRADAANPDTPRGKGLFGDVKALFNSPWITVSHDDGKPSANDNPLGRYKGSDVKSLAHSLELRGIGKIQAIGAAGGIYGEGGGLGMSQDGAFGIGQWRGQRYQALIKKYGLHPTLTQQLDFLVAELKGTAGDGEKGGKFVLGASTINEAMFNYADKFMRPDKPGEHTQAMADYGRGQRGAIASGVVKVELNNKTGSSANVTANSMGRVG